MRGFVAAIVQMRSGIEPKHNIEAMRDLVREAATQGAEYVQTPEMTGSLMRDREALRASLAPADRDEVAVAAAELARDLGIYLHIGSTAVRLEGELLANRSFLFAPDGSLRASYDKIHMFDVDLDHGERWRESEAYRPGSAATVTTVGDVGIGMAICYDLRFPELFRRQAMAGAEVLTVPAAFTRQTGEAHWHVLQRARAIENGAWVIAAAQGGRHEDGRETFGHSLIVDPWGRIVTEIGHDRPGIALARIDAAASDAARARIPNLANGRAFELSLEMPESGKDREAS